MNRSTRIALGVGLILLGVVFVVVAVTNAGAKWMLPVAIVAIVIAAVAQARLRRSR